MPDPNSFGFHLIEATIDDIHRAMRSGQLSCRDLVSGYRQRIEAYNHAGPNLNAIQNTNSKALHEAEKLDTAFRAGGLSGPLHYIPVVVKGQIDTRDMPTTYALYSSRLVLGFPALTVPAGMSSEELPVGLEFMGRPFTEAILFRLGYAYEQGTHHRKPPASTPRLRNEP